MKKDILLTILFITLGVLTRTIFHLGQNIEFVTAITLASAYFFSDKKLSVLVPLITLFMSDLIIGNTAIYIFTWSGFLFTALIGLTITSKKFQQYFSNNFSRLFVLSESSAIISTLIFFLWTNFGVVIESNMYERSLNGLMQSYINALPFLRNQLFGNIVFVPLVFFATYLALNIELFKKIKHKN